MKRFTRCTNCRQWYLHTVTSLVEIYQSDARRWTTVWCEQCVTDAEQRSQPLSRIMSGATGEVPIRQSPGVLPHEECGHGVEPAADHSLLMAEHLHLMERALHEDETILISSIEDFMRRCRLSQEATGELEHDPRLGSSLQYWEAFLKALYQSNRL